MQVLRQIFGKEIPSEGAPTGFSSSEVDTPEGTPAFSLTLGTIQEGEGHIDLRQPLDSKAGDQGTAASSEVEDITAPGRDDAFDTKISRNAGDSSGMAMIQETEGLLGQGLAVPFGRKLESASEDVRLIRSGNPTQSPMLAMADVALMESPVTPAVNMERSSGTKAGIVSNGSGNAKNAQSSDVTAASFKLTTSSGAQTERSNKATTTFVKVNPEQTIKRQTTKTMTTPSLSLTPSDATSDTSPAGQPKPSLSAPFASDQADKTTNRTTANVTPQPELRDLSKRDAAFEAARNLQAEQSPNPSRGGESTEQSGPRTQISALSNREAASTPVEIVYRLSTVERAKTSKSKSGPSEQTVSTTSKQPVRTEGPVSAHVLNTMTTQRGMTTRLENVRQADLGTPAVSITSKEPANAEVLVTASVQKHPHAMREMRTRSEQAQQSDWTVPKQKATAATSPQNAPAVLNANPVSTLPQPFVAVGFDAPATADALQPRDIVFHGLGEGSDIKKESITPAKGESFARPVVQQLVQAAKSAGDGTIEIKLAPEELGRVRLALTPNEANITVHVSAERPETADLIRRNIDLLSASLKEEGFTNLEFSFGEHGGDQMGPQTEDTPKPASKDVTTIETTPIQDERPQTVVAGRLDIRI
jgi:flagellar hook-length control protein FliK